MKRGILILAALAVAGCASPTTTAGRPPHKPAPPPLQQTGPTGEPVRSVGVWEPQEYSDFGQVATFGRLTGTKPTIVLTYETLGEPFLWPLATKAYRYGATLFVQMQPGRASMASIAAGEHDQALRAYATAVKDFRRPVIISFAAEMNGFWYPWGWKHTPPTQWVAAWRHIVRLFRSAGATNAEWLWCVGPQQNHAPPLAHYWPGAAYVNQVGIDGYFYVPGETFGSLFGSTIRQVRAITADPILLSETAVGTFPGRGARISALFAAAAQRGIAGVVWFDEAQYGGIYRQDWRLEDDPRALAAFRAAARSYLNA